LTPEHSDPARNKAAALKYNPDEDIAPVVIASGYGSVAEKIIDIAEQKGIPVYKDDSAASLLCMLDVGSRIPVELYQVIAAIYGQIISASQKILSDQNGPTDSGDGKNG
jgi:FlhB-like protein